MRVRNLVRNPLLISFVVVATIMGSAVVVIKSRASSKEDTRIPSLIGSGDNNGIGMKYDIDPKTGLCFLVNSWSAANNYSITNVPCTKEVIAAVPPENRQYARVIMDTKPAPQ